MLPTSSFEELTLEDKGQKMGHGSKCLDVDNRLTKSAFLHGLWPLLSLGKIFGMIHLKREGPSKVIYSPRSIFTVLSVVIWVTYVVFFAFAIIIFIRQLKSPDRNLVEQFLDLIYHLHITLTVSFCIYESKNFPELFNYWLLLEAKLLRLESLVEFNCCQQRGEMWRKSYKTVHFLPFAFTPSVLSPTASLLNVVHPIKQKVKETRNHRKESNFVLVCWVLIGGYFTCAVIGAMAYFNSIGVRTKPKSVACYLEVAAEIYVLSEYSTWWIGVYVVVVGHVMEISWAYGDMLILFFSNTLRYEFKRFNKTLEVVKQCNPSDAELELLRATHWDIALGVKKVDCLLGFITTTTFTCNILYLFSRVYLGLAEDLSSPSHSIVFEAMYAFAYLIGRIFFSALIASRLNDETNRTLSILMQFSEENKGETHFLIMERFCNQVMTGNVALTGNGYFILNRNFIASLVSAIATYEIIIIQFSSS